MTAKTIQELIRQYKIREAFWAAADGVENDTQKQTLFLQILSFKNNVAILQAHSDILRQEAERGENPYMAYAYARLHDVLQPEENSAGIKEMYYTIAANHGIGDAYACLAYMYRDGDLGEQDMETYENLMRKARQRRSEKALQQIIRDLVFGNNGAEANPSKAYELAENYLKELDFPNPAYYQLMAQADEKLGRKVNAICNFESAATYGNSSAFYWWAIAECCDDAYNVVDRRRFMEIMQKGIDVYAADCFLMYSMLLDDESYESLDENDKAEVKRSLLNDLKTGWKLGEAECPYFLADYFENGRFGFEKDYEKAWLWYSRGAALRSPSCLGALARMVLDDGTAPSSYDESYGYECAYKGLLLGADDLLEVVIRGYKNGFLTQHSTMIERKWLPKYEKEVGEMMDDHELDGDEYDDGHEYLYDGDPEFLLHIEPEREIEED